MPVTGSFQARAVGVLGPICMCPQEGNMVPWTIRAYQSLYVIDFIDHMELI